MKATVIAVVCTIVLSTLADSLHSKMLVRIYDPVPAEVRKGLDMAGRRSGEWIDVVIEDRELAGFAHLKTEILIEDLDAFHAAQKGEYHNYPDVVDSLEAVSVNHPSIVRLDTIGTTWEGRDILAVKISDNVGTDESEPEVLFIGLHHAREWPSLEICLFYVDTMTSAYGTDTHITDIVDSLEIWIIPCMNVDGYIYCHDQGYDWRKNRRFFPEFGTYGVDLNRNYDGSTNGEPLGQWGSIPGGTSHSPNSEVYCGPAPVSEPETEAVRDFILERDFICAVSYHTYQESVLWSWGYTYDYAPDRNVLSDIGEEMASRITRQSGMGTYDAHQSAGLYPTTGDFCDWGYGASLYEEGKNLLAYTVEACASFHPSESYLDQIVRENFDGALYICDVADSIATLLSPRVMPPEIVELDTSETGSYTVVWSQTNPSALPDYYQLDELSGYSVFTDDVESGSGLWQTVYFSTGTGRYHSSSHAYFSNLTSGNEASFMRTIWPLLVSAEDSLTFWCWYDIEEGWDYGYVEVSLDGRRWFILDEFTGSSSGWVRKAYSLDSHAGRSIFIQFRYITDDYYEEEGLWVDDIHPVSDFASLTTVAANTPDTTHPVGPKEDGVYYYTVKGHNGPREWGDWSQLEDIVVIAGVQNICGDCNGDSCITFLDMAYLSDYLSLGGPAPLGSGDVDEDGDTDTDDLLFLGEYLFDGGPSPCGITPPFCAPTSSPGNSVVIGDAVLCCSTTSVSLPLTVENVSPLIGMTFALQYDTGVVVCDSATFDPGLFGSWSAESRLDTDGGTVLMAVWTPSLVSLQQLSPGSHEVGTVWFTSLIPSDAGEGTSEIDTTFLLPGHVVSVVDGSQALLGPEVEAGRLDIWAHCGDVNSDCRVTVADALYLTTYIYRDGPPPVCAGDVNLDARISVADATYLVTYIYRDGPPPCNPPPPVLIPDTQKRRIEK